MQAEADDTVIVRVERPGGVFAQHGAEGIDERLPAEGPAGWLPNRLPVTLVAWLDNEVPACRAVAWRGSIEARAPAL